MKTTLLSTLIASGIALATLTGAAQTQKAVWWCTAAPLTKCAKWKTKDSVKSTMLKPVYPQRFRQHAGEGGCREEKPAG